MIIILYFAPLVFVCVYVRLATRMRWSTFWMTAAGLGLVHGALHMLLLT